MTRSVGNQAFPRTLHVSVSCIDRGYAEFLISRCFRRGKLKSWLIIDRGKKSLCVSQEGLFALDRRKFTRSSENPEEFVEGDFSSAINVGHKLLLSADNAK